MNSVLEKSASVGVAAILAGSGIAGLNANDSSMNDSCNSNSSYICPSREFSQEFSSAERASVYGFDLPDTISDQYWKTVVMDIPDSKGNDIGAVSFNLMVSRWSENDNNTDIIFLNSHFESHRPDVVMDTVDIKIQPNPDKAVLIRSEPNNSSVSSEVTTQHSVGIGTDKVLSLGMDKSVTETSDSITRFNNSSVSKGFSEFIYEYHAGDIFDSNNHKVYSCRNNDQSSFSIWNIPDDSYTITITGDISFAKYKNGVFGNNSKTTITKKFVYDYEITDGKFTNMNFETQNELVHLESFIGAIVGKKDNDEQINDIKKKIVNVYKEIEGKKNDIERYKVQYENFGNFGSSDAHEKLSKAYLDVIELYSELMELLEEYDSLNDSTVNLSYESLIHEIEISRSNIIAESPYTCFLPCERLVPPDETVTNHSDETVTNHSDETVTNHSDETVTNHSDETVTDHSDETVTDHSYEIVTDYSGEMATNHSYETITDRSDEIVTDYSGEMATNHSDETTTSEVSPTLNPKAGCEYYIVSSGNPNLAITPEGSKNYSRLKLDDICYSNKQKWRIESDGRIVNCETKKCIDVSVDSISQIKNQTVVWTYDSTGVPESQKFSLINHDDSNFYIGIGSFVLDVKGDNVKSGSPIQMFSVTPYVNNTQMFQFIPA